MKTFRKITAVCLTLILALTLTACKYEEKTNPTDIYGVISFKEIDGEEAMFAFVPLDFCGEIRIYLSQSSSSSSPYDSYSEGDLVKMHFDDTPQIRDLGYFKAFWYAPNEITAIKKDIKLEKSGVDYLLNIPKILVNGEVSDKVYAYDQTLQKGVLDVLTVTESRIEIRLLKEKAHSSLALLEYELLASTK